MENIKAEAFSEYMKDYFPDTKTIEVAGIEVIVKRHLSISEMIDFVDMVVSNCFQDDEYVPQLKDFLIRMQIVRKYTNIELPDGIDNQYNFVYSSDLIPMIVDEVINRNEFNNILQAIDCKIAYVEDVAHQEYKQKIDEIYSSILSITNQVSEMYKDMSAEELTDLVKIVANMDDGSASEEEIVKAMMRYREANPQIIEYDPDALVKEVGE